MELESARMETIADEIAVVEPASPETPRIFEAMLGSQGAVARGTQIGQAAAEARRKAGHDVVVCGPNLAANRRLAETIERNANTQVRRCPPHPNAGPKALPHYQPDPRPPEGHTFYETPTRKCV
jgi:ribulose-5-phosphate 4-epimerase/fuculose-1-phosphate aldolase